jgi:hypothetical protein
MLAHLVLIPFTGCGINPARTFGPHIVIIMAGEKAGAAGWWIFYTAPFVGYVNVIVCELVILKVDSHHCRSLFSFIFSAPGVLLSSASTSLEFETLPTLRLKIR